MACEYANLSVSPASIEFSIDAGSAFVPAKQWIDVKKIVDGNKTLDAGWDVSSTEDWCVLGRSGGRGRGTFSVTAKSIGKPIGEYTAEIQFKSHVQVTPSVVFVTLKVIGVVPEPPTPEPVPEPTPEPPEPTPEPPIPEPEPEQKWCLLSRVIRSIIKNV